MLCKCQPLKGNENHNKKPVEHRRLALALLHVCAWRARKDDQQASKWSNLRYMHPTNGRAGRSRVTIVRILSRKYVVNGGQGILNVLVNDKLI